MYHSKGVQSKVATECNHTSRNHYAKGLCKHWYFSYYKQRVVKRIQDIPDDIN